MFSEFMNKFKKLNNMATIIEIKKDKLEHLSEYAEKVLKYGGKLNAMFRRLEEGI